VGEEPADIHYTARDEEYLRRVSAEAEHWDLRPEDVFPPETVPKLQAYYNERFTGDCDSQWYEVIPKYGEFTHGCALGCGPQALERRVLALNPSLHLTFYDISGVALSQRLRQLGSEFPGRVEIRQEDLNFALLPENAYDFIISQSAMHHIVNLEHAAYQANNALTSNGVLFLRDFVAESRLQFCEMKKRTFEAIAYATGPRLEAPLRFDWPDTDNWQYSPFEAVRSGDILQVFRTYLQEVELHVAGAMTSLLLYARLPPNPAQPRCTPLRKLTSPLARWWTARAASRLRNRMFQKQQLGDLLIIVDRIVSEAGCLTPALAFGVYRKRQRGQPDQEK
jgi:SAM-dependent methyltransferase